MIRVEAQFGLRFFLYKKYDIIFKIPIKTKIGIVYYMKGGI